MGPPGALEKSEVQFGKVLDYSVEPKWGRHQRITVSIKRDAEVPEERLEVSRSDKAEKASVVLFQLKRVRRFGWDMEEVTGIQ